MIKNIYYYAERFLFIPFIIRLNSIVLDYVVCLPCGYIEMIAYYNEH